MEAIISLVITLTMLILLQAVLGFDNLLYISLESKRAPEADRQTVRRWGIGLAVGLRIVLLLVLIKVVGTFKQSLFSVHWAGVIEVDVSLHSLIVLLGGIFIMYTATREIFHMLSLHDLNQSMADSGAKSSRAVIMRIVAMNLVFSFDSILSAMALTDNFWVMAAAILVSGGMMIWLADRVAAFLQRNRMYEVFDFIVADPPYGKKNTNRRSGSAAQKMLDDKHLPALLNKDARLLLGHARRDQLDILSPWHELKTLQHGDNWVRFLELQ